VAAATAAYLHLSLPRIPDRDAFYHLAHARLYVQEGPFTSEFPWPVYSVITRYSADLWYGLHVLLMPFTFLAAPHLQIKLSGVLLLALTLVLFYLAMRRSRISYPFLWPFLVLFATPVFLYRLLMTRPHVLSVGIAALLLACMASGSVWAVGLLCFAFTFVHLNFFWVVPVVVGVVVVVKFFTEQVWEWRKALAALIGAGLGLLLRPNPIGAAKLVYIQVISVALAKQEEVPMLFGADLAPGADLIRVMPAAVFLDFWPLMVLYVAAAFVFLAALFNPESRLAARSRSLLWTSFVLSALFLWSALSVAWRSVDLFVAFGVTLVASVFTLLLRERGTEEEPWMTRRARALLVSGGALLLAFMAWHALSEHAGRMRSAGSLPYRYQEAAEWLRDNSQPGEIVFHNNWDLFGELFYWNTHNRYIGGMDPIFQYAYNKELYWKAHHLYIDAAGRYTWGAPNRSLAPPEETYTVLREDFNAAYLAVVETRTPRFYSYLMSDPRFRPAIESGGLTVFELLDPNDSPPRPGPQ